MGEDRKLRPVEGAFWGLSFEGSVQNRFCQVQRLVFNVTEKLDRNKECLFGVAVAQQFQAQLQFLGECLSQMRHGGVVRS